MTPLMSIVIVNWNVRSLLRACLESVRRETRAGRFEIVMVDNASTDGSVEMVRREFPEVHLIANDVNVGFGRANNQALPCCRGRYLVLLNPDTVVLDGALDRLLDWIEQRPRAAVVGCRLLNSDGSLQRWTGGAMPTLANVAGHYLLLNHLVPEPLRPRPLFRVRDTASAERVGWVSGACLVARVTALRGRLFDESFFMYGEDMELCDRLARDGWQIWFVPTASIVHHHGMSMEQRPRETNHEIDPLAGQRALFARGRGAISLVLYDTVVATGFGLRWLAYTLAGMASGSYATRAAKSGRLLKMALRVRRAGNHPAMAVR